MLSKEKSEHWLAASVKRFDEFLMELHRQTKWIDNDGGCWLRNSSDRVLAYINSSGVYEIYSMDGKVIVNDRYPDGLNESSKRLVETALFGLGSFEGGEYRFR